MTAALQNASAEPLAGKNPNWSPEAGVGEDLQPPVARDGAGKLWRGGGVGGGQLDECFGIQWRRNEASRVLVLLTQSNKREDCWKRGRGPERPGKDGEVEGAF